MGHHAAAGRAPDGPVAGRLPLQFYRDATGVHSTFLSQAVGLPVAETSRVALRFPEGGRESAREEGGGWSVDGESCGLVSRRWSGERRAGRKSGPGRGRNEVPIGGDRTISRGPELIGGIVASWTPPAI